MDNPGSLSTKIERDLIEALAGIEPIFHEAHDQCVFCNKEPGYGKCAAPNTRHTGHRYTVHEADCPWIRAMRYLDRLVDCGHAVDGLNEGTAVWNEKPHGMWTRTLLPQTDGERHAD